MRKKRKILLWAIPVVIVVISGIILTFFILNKHKVDKDLLVFDAQNKIVEIYSEVPQVKDYIDIVEDQKSRIDLSKVQMEYLNDQGQKVEISTEEIDGKMVFNALGTYQVHLYNLEKTLDLKVTLSVVDTTPPQLVVKDATVSQGQEYKVEDFVESCTDNSKSDCSLSFAEDELPRAVGVYEIVIVASDPSGNTTKQQAKLSITSRTSSMTRQVTKSSKGYDIVTENGVTYIDGILIVNKTYALPENYGDGLTDQMLSAFEEMKQQASAEGISLSIVSGFRSYSYQRSLYNRYVQEDGQAAADTYSARAGHSEHQSGLAFDLNWVDNAFKDTNEGIWLAHNAYKYGFILRYPENKTNETGYIFEPWHYRYVGVDLAERLYNNGDWITLEDYFGITSNYS